MHFSTLSSTQTHSVSLINNAQILKSPPGYLHQGKQQTTKLSQHGWIDSLDPEGHLNIFTAYLGLLLRGQHPKQTSPDLPFPATSNSSRGTPMNSQANWEIYLSPRPPVRRRLSEPPYETLKTSSCGPTTSRRWHGVMCNGGLIPSFKN